MVRLLGGVFYLVLRRAASNSHRSIAIFDNFEKVISSWSAGQRVSPIFSLEGARPPALRRSSAYSLLLLGPCAPDRFMPLPSPHCFLSMGLYNILVFSRTQEESLKALAQANGLAVPWEQWILEGARISSVQQSKKQRSRAGRDTTAKSIRPADQPQNLREATREYLAVSASTLALASLYSDFSPDIERFDQQFRAYITQPGLRLPEARKYYALASAALSRFSSLTFTGISPILENECHYWTHSLLGVGTASLALFRFRQFLEDIFARARLKERISCLKEEPSGPPIESLNKRDPFWDKDHLFEYPSQKKVPDPSEPGSSDDVLPLMTTFSSRDGFRGTAVSLSAPLEVISSCNVIDWTPMTLTHEFSHIIIEPILGKLLPSEKRDYAEAVNWTIGKKAPSNMFDQLRASMCYALSEFEESEITEKDQFTPDVLESYISAYGPILNEILTHCFDFQYFYRRDAEAYIHAVWATWGTVPNLHGNLFEYVVRCLCALHTQNLSRANGREESLRQLKNNLEKAGHSLGDVPYIADAIKLLKKDKEYLLETLGRRELAVQFARHLLYSSRIERLMLQESISTGGDRGGYSFKVLEFNGDPIESPLRFVDTFARDRNPDAIRALWLLTQLAFQMPLR